MHDPELPRGFQDADFDMRDLEDAARDADRLRRKGICSHGWGQELTEYTRALWNPEVPKDAPVPSFYCFHCGAVLESDAISKGRHAVVLRPATKDVRPKPKGA